MHPSDFAAHRSCAAITRDCGEYIESQIYFLKCFELDPTFSNLNTSYGYLLYLMGDYDNAMKYIEIDLNKDYPKQWTFISYGLLHSVMGNDVAAREAFMNAIAVIHDNGDDKYQVQLRVLELKTKDKFHCKGYDTLLELLKPKTKSHNGYEWKGKVVTGCIIAGVASIVAWYWYRHGEVNRTDKLIK